MDFGFTIAAYAVAGCALHPLAGWLSGQESAKRAVWYGIVGMAIAVVATLIGPGSGLAVMSLILIAAGAAVGYQLATRVQMTQMPELVAIMHSLVGLAAVFVGFNAHIEIGRVAADLHAEAGLPFPQPEGPLERGGLCASGHAVELRRADRQEDRGRDRHPAGRTGARHLDRRRDLHRLGRGLWQAVGQLEPAAVQDRHGGQAAARRAHAQRGRGGGLGAPADPLSGGSGTWALVLLALWASSSAIT
jgi:hypothetical protein